MTTREILTGLRRGLMRGGITVLLATLAARATAQQQAVFTQGAPPPVQAFGATTINPPTTGGTQTLYYWVVARYPIGAAIPGGPAVAANTPGLGNITAQSFVRIGWSPMPGAIGYDVVRSASPNYPAPCTACAVVLNTQLTSVDDNGGVLSDYPPSNLRFAQPATVDIALNNRDATTPYLQTALNGSAIGRVGVLSGTFTANDCAKINADGTLSSNGAACAGAAPANVVTYISGAGAPAGACTPGTVIYRDTVNGLQYSCYASGDWRTVAFGAGDITMNTAGGARVLGIQNVAVAYSGLTSGNILVYNGTNWVNQAPAGADPWPYGYQTISMIYEDDMCGFVDSAAARFTSMAGWIWQTTAAVASRIKNYTVTTAGRPCTVRIGAAGLANFDTSFLRTSANQDAGWSTASNFDMVWIVSYSNTTTTDLIMRFGLTDSTAGGDNVGNGPYWNKITGNVLQACVRVAGTPVCSAAGTVTAGTFYTLRFRKTGAAQVTFNVDNGADIVVNGALPAGAVYAHVMAYSGGSVDWGVDIDYIGLRYTGLARP